MVRALEEKLIRLAAAGDKAAAEQLIKGHQGPLYGYILRLSGRPETAEDVVQEAFIRVLTNLDKFDARYRFSTWLFTIARRIYINLSERKRARTGADETLDAAAAGGEAPTTVAQGHELQHRFRGSLAGMLLELSPEQREVVVLFHQQEWPMWLIAEQLEIPLGTVKSHLHRGRLRLREMMLHAGITPKDIGIETADAEEVKS